MIAVFLLPMTAFATDDALGSDAASEEVLVDESYTDSSGVDISNDVIEETDEQAAVKMLEVSGSSANSTNYSYTITPILSPFNQYFFVKTDNPDPSSFRFADMDSAYGENAVISLNWDSRYDKIVLYPDVHYENTETGRVNGGYIFRSYDTDGGEVVLQETDNPKASSPVWNNTNIKKTLPALVDVADYLISTYADKNSFFDNMTAVQKGFSGICLYSGSYVRGTLLKPNDYWFVAVAGHVDQSFYIYSPYDRENSRTLFATAVYPFRYDSLGFPNMMGRVAQRLDSTATFKWNSSYHYLIDVTYGGETKSYGGQGEGQGQGITQDKIQQYFTFGSGGTDITLSDMRSLLENYAALQIEDDIPRDDALTWNQVYDAAGSGTWARISGSNAKIGSKWTLDPSVYTFIYQKGDGQTFDADEWSVGYSTYFSGDLGYARDAWVDGRYVSTMRKYIPGETFADHPTSNIILCDVAIPQITYEQTYNSSLSAMEYQNINITEENKTVLFKYADGKWTAAREAFYTDCATYEKIALFAEKGLIDEQYLDMVTITQEEIESLGIDRNTNITPAKGCIFDGIEPPGTLFDHEQGHCWNLGKVTTTPTCTAAGEKQFTCLVCGETRNEPVPAAGHDNPMVHVAAKEATCASSGNTEYWYCKKCRKYFGDKDGENEIKRWSWDTGYADHQWDDGVVTEKPTCTEEGVITYTCTVCQDSWTDLIDPTGHKWTHVKNKAGLLKNGSEYDQCTYCKIKKNIKKLTGYATYYVKGFKLAAAKASFTAKWTKQSKANQKKFSGYQIRYSTKSSMKNAKTVTAGKKSASKKITKLKKKTKYYVQIRTYTVSKNVKYYSKWSAKKAVKTK